MSNAMQLLQVLPIYGENDILEVFYAKKNLLKDQYDFTDGDFNTPGLFIKYSTNTLESSEEKWLYQGESFLAEVKGSIFRNENLKIRSIDGKFSSF